MRIMVLSTDSDAGELHNAARVALLNKSVGSDVEIAFSGQKASQICVDSLTDIVLTGPETLVRAIQAERDGFDALCLYCGSDPAYDACRELLRIPVVGAAHAALTMASVLGSRYSFITTNSRRIPQKRDFLIASGADPHRLVSVRSITYDMTVENEYRDTLRQLTDVTKICYEQDGADTVILGCLSFAGMGSEISAASGITVIDPAAAMIVIAEAVVRMGISHSKIAWPYPQTAQRGWRNGTLNT